MELTIIRPGEEPVGVEISKDVVTIGRDDTCDVVLQGDLVSRKHALIQKLPNGTYELKDLGSKNGVHLKGLKINSAQVLSGDEFRVGDTEFVIKVPQS